MKKLLSLLLVVMMLASLSVYAFAAAGSPTQDTSEGQGVEAAEAAAATTADEDKEEAEDADLAEAEEAEEEAVKAVTETTAEDNQEGKSVLVAVGKLDEAKDTEPMKEEFAALADTLVAAKASLAADATAAIPAEVKADAGDKEVAAGQPFRVVASEYPATITIKVENPDAFVNMMVFVDGKWVKLNTTVNEDGTVTFVLDQPYVMSIVSAIEQAP